MPAAASRSRRPHRRPRGLSVAISAKTHPSRGHDEGTGDRGERVHGQSAGGTGALLMSRTISKIIASIPSCIGSAKAHSPRAGVGAVLQQLTHSPAHRPRGSSLPKATPSRCSTAVGPPTSLASRSGLAAAEGTVKSADALSPPLIHVDLSQQWKRGPAALTVLATAARSAG